MEKQVEAATTASSSVTQDGQLSDNGSTDTIVEYAPADSAYGWVIVACAAFNLMCTIGIFNSFGVYSTYYLNYIYPDKSAADIAWIGTTRQVISFGGSVMSGPLTDRFGFRNVSLAGAIISSSALLISSFAKPLWFAILTQGVLFGLGATLMFSMSMSLPAQWHTKRRALATGIAVAGAGVGGMIFTEVTQRLMESVGLQWTLRISALLIFCISGTASLFYKRRVSVPPGGNDFKAIMLDRRLIAAGLAALFICIGYFVPWFYLPTAALDIGQSNQQVSYLVIYMNAGTTVGRLFTAFLATAIGPVNTLIVAYIICVVMFLTVMLAAKTMAAYTALAFIYGAFSSSQFALPPVVLAGIFGPQAVTTAMGIMNMWGSIGILIGNPSQGAVYQAYDRPHKSFMAITLLGCSGLFLGIVWYGILKVLLVRGTKKSYLSRL
ncbi:MFS general substrate transporter [Linderina pennispora]|uniref:MFS general substrate transporter n=1 Tax=Linderina pennispora TaxID=61395 RepID=A0A1Y1W8P0_9FUNG|nr:MFS general substrate transporter [Linderina pennispora]ORX69900.1 MFS general substrate transporter [Linderina pennispora]